MSEPAKPKPSRAEYYRAWRKTVFSKVLRRGILIGRREMQNALLERIKDREGYLEIETLVKIIERVE